VIDLNKLSEKELLEMFSGFPKHELTTEQRTEMLRVIGEQRHRKTPKVNIQRIAAFAAMFLLLVIAPILYFSNGEAENLKRAGTVTEKVEPAEQGVYFALDDKGTPIYADSNFGIPNKVSLLAPQEWVASDYRSVSKLMVFLWGDGLDTNQKLKIEASHVKTGNIDFYVTTKLSAGIYGTDAHAVLGFPPFKRQGIYNLRFTIGEKAIGEFSINVKEPYVTIGRSTLLISQEDLFAGLYEDVNIEVVGDDLPPEIELELFDLENAEATVFTFKDKTDYTTADGRKISLYTGDFTIKKSGKYRFSVLNESQAVEVRKP
jgi:hypothetical protein